MKTALILAAGRGERLRPLSDKTPKALAQVKGQSLIAYHLDKLAMAGFERVVINHAHLGGQIRRYLGQGAAFGLEIIYSPEPPGGLETGGGVFNALNLLGDAAFLTVNADIYTDFDFSTLQNNWSYTAMAHLILGPNPAHNAKGDFSFKEGPLLALGADHTFLGIAVYHPAAFSNCHIGRYPLINVLHSLIQQQQVTGELYTGLWIDIGTIARLSAAQQSVGNSPRATSTLSRLNKA